MADQFGKEKTVDEGELRRQAQHYRRLAVDLLKSEAEIAEGFLELAILYDLAADRLRTRGQTQILVDPRR